MGILLAHYLLELKKHDVNSDRDYMLTSAVSSQFLSVLGEATGFAVEETLTGFKWLGKRALELENQGRKVHLAYEEALGYMFPDIVYDKDGIAAAIVFLRACASWGSPFAKLQDLYAQYGYFRTSNTYWRSPNQETTEAVFESIRRLGTPFPPHVGERRVARWRDLTIGYDSSTEDHAPNLPLSKGGEMITCWLERDTSNETPDDTTIRFTVRTSGTEPKIKIYLESRSSDSNSARKSAVQTLELVSREWFADPRLVMEKINYS